MTPPGEHPIHGNKQAKKSFWNGYSDIPRNNLDIKTSEAYNLLPSFVKSLIYMEN